MIFVKLFSIDSGHESLCPFPEPQSLSMGHLVNITGNTYSKLCITPKITFTSALTNFMRTVIN